MESNSLYKEIDCYKEINNKLKILDDLLEFHNLFCKVKDNEDKIGLFYWLNRVRNKVEWGYSFQTVRTWHYVEEIFKQYIAEIVE